MEINYNGFMKAKVCTVVVTYNRLELLKGAIDALRAQSFSSDILVVNNGSTDGTDKYLDSQKDLHVIHQENLGGAGGFYTGMKYAAENGYEFAWVMDDDVLPDVNALKCLKEAYDFLKDKENVGFLCSTVVNPNGEPVNIPLVDLKRNVTGYPSWNRHLSDGLVGVSSATFVSVFVPCSIIYEVGLPYKEFFIWGDDTEYTNRISVKFPSFLVGSSVITHLRNGGAIDLLTLKDKNRIKMYRYSIRNKLFNSRYCPFKERLIDYLWVFVVIGRLLRRGAFYKLTIVVRGIVEGLYFNPKIQYPQR